MESQLQEDRCVNCGAPLPPQEGSDGERTCSAACAIGHLNGLEMKRTMEIGYYWGAYLKKLGMEW